MKTILNRDKKFGVRAAATRTLTLAVTVLALAGVYELYRWIWVTTGWTHPFPVNDTTLPHLWTIFKALGEPSRYQGPLLITVLLKSAWFTAKEALAGFAMGAIVGFALAVGHVH
jgi:ABC-type nitrate/sulfonate/bicarbonate transport system permease component